MKKIYIYAFAVSLSLSSCIDSFLENDPKNLQTEVAAFVTSDNFKTYSWGLYEAFAPRSGEDVNFYQWEKDIESGLMVNNNSWNYENNIWAYQKVQNSTRNGLWNFDFIRRVNTMLDNIDNSKMSDKDKAHWRSVGYFFRAYRYFQMLSSYGDLPWIEHVPTESDTEIIYGIRDSRDVVAKNILDNLIYAEANVYPAGNGSNTINQKVVRALISRFALFEGTWRKYHNLQDSQKYLQACFDYSKKLVESVPNLHPCYADLFSSQSLAEVAEILLYREYADNVMTHQAVRQVGSSGNGYELTKKMVDLYLCRNGKPIHNETNDQFMGEKDPYDEFKNRDIRMLMTVLPPYRVNRTAKLVWRYYSPKAKDTYTIGGVKYNVTVEDSLKFRSNMDIVAANLLNAKRELPGHYWNRSDLNPAIPRFRDYNEGFSPFSGYHGYWLWKYYNTNIAPLTQGQNDSDLPLFRIGETMLNYAEAAFELGKFDQGIADVTINKLRERGKVAPMIINRIDDNFDPNRDQTVPAVLWEIRRERHVELIGENFACDDIRRWKKGEYVNERPKGMWAKNSDYGNKLKLIDKNGNDTQTEGYSVRQYKTKGWKNEYYLDPIPMTDLVLNPNLKQNPGYTNAKGEIEAGIEK